MRISTPPREYRSRRTWRGIPLVHVARGWRGPDGRYHAGQARGIVAVGGVAVGVIAVGGVAVGVISAGGVALGVFALGAVAVAVAGVGVASIAVLAVGAVAIGVVAVGVVSLGATSTGIVQALVVPTALVRRRHATPDFLYRKSPTVRAWRPWTTSRGSAWRCSPPPR